MDLDKLLALAEKLQAIIVGFPILIGILGHLWHNVRKWAHELALARQDGFASAAEYLWTRGQQIKADLRASEKSQADLLPRLRELAPDVLVKFGLATGASREDVEKLLELARMVHKAKKGTPLVSGVSIETLPEPVPEDPLAAPAE